MQRQNTFSEIVTQYTLEGNLFAQRDCGSKATLKKSSMC